MGPENFSFSVKINKIEKSMLDMFASNFTYVTLKVRHDKTRSALNPWDAFATSNDTMLACSVPFTWFRFLTSE